MQYDPGMETTSLKKEGLKWWEAHGKDLPRLENREELDIARDRTLRIGMVSPDFRSHPVGFLAIQLVENSDHPGLQFYCYSDCAIPDEYTRRFEKATDHWSDIKGLSDLEVIDKIQQDRIDILFDLNGHTKNNRLTMFARKPAPIQVAWIEPGTRGLPTIDYFLADQFHVPEAHENQFSEKVIRLPHGYVCYDPPIWSPPVSPLPAKKNGFVTFGCFNNPVKVNDRILQKWAEILKTLPNSKLIMKYRGMDAASNQKRVLTIFAGQGIDGSRIVFEGISPRRVYIERYNDIDIALDTWPFSSGVTACEALWMGVPTVTFPGLTFAGRHSFCHMMNVGVMDPVAENLESYVETALSLATDIETLASIRSGLREKMAASPLCDGPRFATDFRFAMRQLWMTYIDGVRHD
jgi:predicted O-linked N-acetylglucosamine transferase (SPINDLY family)